MTTPTPDTTTLNLIFNGVSTGPITYTGTPGDANTPGTDIYNIQTALDSLSSIANVGGSVQVSADPTDTIFTIIFTGTLLGLNQPPLSVQSNDGSASLFTFQHGAGGTVVEPGQVLELQTSLLGEPVELNGNGTLFNGHFTGACATSAITTRSPEH